MLARVQTYQTWAINWSLFFLNSEIDGLVEDYLSLRQAGNKIPNRHYCMAGPNFYTYGVGVAMPKTSPWLEQITKVVFEMKQNGTIKILENMYFDEKMCSSSTAKDLDILNLSGLFLTVAATIGFCFLALLVEVIAIFVLVRFRHQLGALGKFSVRLLFDLKKGEEHLITLQYSTKERRRKCVKMDVVKIKNALPNVATAEMQRDSISTIISFETCERSTRGLVNGSFETNSTSHSIPMSFTNGGFYDDNLNPTVTPL